MAITITGPSSVSGEITMASGGAEQLTYNAVNSGSVLPASMNVYVNGVQLAGVTLMAKYIGQSFTFTPVGGSALPGVFAEGNVYLTTVTTTVAAGTTTAGPVNYAPNTDGYSSVLNVYHLNGGSNHNNGGTIKSGGNVSDPMLFESVPKVYNNERQVFASVVVDNNSADKAVNAGTFAYNRQRPIAKKVTTQLGGVSNYVLRSGAAQPALVKSINKLETLRTRRFTTAIRENHYNRFTGQFDPNTPVVAVDSLGADTAATPTKSLPGQLVFKIGAKVPVTSNYKPKTN
jgi:hypothetical protein